MPSFNVQAFWNAMEVQEAPDDNPEECEPNDEHDGGNDGKCDGGHNHEQVNTTMDGFMGKINRQVNIAPQIFQQRFSEQPLHVK